MARLRKHIQSTADLIINTDFGAAHHVDTNSFRVRPLNRSEQASFRPGSGIIKVVHNVRSVSKQVAAPHHLFWPQKRNGSIADTNRRDRHGRTCFETGHQRGQFLACVRLAQPSAVGRITPGDGCFPDTCRRGQAVTRPASMPAQHPPVTVRTSPLGDNNGGTEIGYRWRYAWGYCIPIRIRTPNASILPHLQCLIPPLQEPFRSPTYRFRWPPPAKQTQSFVHCSTSVRD
jgi:hypothetical protein